ncbi:MAG: glycosyltransferase 87 family protein [Janthinobacterium lividum]
MVELPQPRRGGAPAVVGLWVLTRALSMLILASGERLVVGDVFYYWRKVSALAEAGLPGTLREYPTPVVWFLSLPQIGGGGSRTGYLVAFIVLMLALDAVLTYVLWRDAGRRHDLAVDFWIAYVFLVGPLCYTRFDMVPAVLAGGALLAARHWPWLTGALTGLGAAIKLWPALLAGAFAARRPGRGQLLGAFVVVGFGLAALSLVTGGASRLFSPLTWQSGRGLQIESVWATPLMVARAFDPARWTVRYSTFQAYEVFGPGVSTLLVVSTTATVLGLGVTVALFVRGYRNPEVTTVGLGLLVLATIAITTITNKTLSPQYLLWLGGPAAALLLARNSEGPRWARVLGRLAVQLLVLALLTQLTYPLLYNGLLGRGTAALAVASTVVTVLRNLSLLVLTVEVCRYAWTALARPRQDDPAGS